MQVRARTVADSHLHQSKRRVSWRTSDASSLLSAQLAVQLGSLIEVSSEDLGHSAVLRPRLPGIAVQQKLVVELEQVLQAALDRRLPGRILKSKIPELLVDLGVEVVQQHLRPELVELLHFLGGLAGLGVLTLLNRRLPNLGVGLALPLLLGESNALPVNPNDPAFGLIRLAGLGISSRICSNAIDAVGK